MDMKDKKTKSKTKGLKIIFSRSFSDFIPSSVHEILNLQEIKNITYISYIT